MKPRSNTPKKVIWHHSNGMALFACAKTQHHTADIIDNSHKTRWPGFVSLVHKNSRGIGWHVGYHLVIDIKNETITQTRAFTEEGAHCIGKNRSSIGILIIGNYDKCSGEEIPKEKEYLLVQAWEMAKAAYPFLTIQDNVPHRTYASKSCFGDSLSANYVQQLITAAKTVQPGDEKQKELLYIKTLREEIVELLTVYIALLTQRLSKKRLSLREVPKKRARPMA